MFTPRNLPAHELNPYASGEDPYAVHERIRAAIIEKIEKIEKIPSKTETHEKQLQELFNDLNNAAENFCVATNRKYYRP